MLEYGRTGTDILQLQYGLHYTLCGSSFVLVQQQARVPSNVASRYYYTATTVHGTRNEKHVLYSQVFRNERAILVFHYLLVTDVAIRPGAGSSLPMFHVVCGLHASPGRSQSINPQTHAKVASCCSYSEHA